MGCVLEWKFSVLQKVDCRLGCALAREHDKLCARERRRGRGSGVGKKKGGRLASLQDQLKYPDGKVGNTKRRDKK